MIAQKRRLKSSITQIGRPDENTDPSEIEQTKPLENLSGAEKRVQQVIKLLSIYFYSQAKNSSVKFDLIFNFITGSSNSNRKE